MRLIINSPRLIGACGLYCPACRNFRKEHCPGCKSNEEDAGLLNRSRLLKCRIRQCCLSKSFRTCAQCNIDVSQCKIYNSLISKLFARLFNSDRAACISYVRCYGEKAFADRMTLHEQMTMKRKV